MKRSLLVISVVALVSLLASCVTMSQPTSIGKNKYMITLNARGGFHSDGELLNRSIEEAKQFCQSKGLTAEIENTNTSGTQMWTPQNNRIEFSCN